MTLIRPNNYLINHKDYKQSLQQQIPLSYKESQNKEREAEREFDFYNHFDSPKYDIFHYIHEQLNGLKKVLSYDNYKELHHNYRGRGTIIDIIL